MRKVVTAAMMACGWRPFRRSHVVYRISRNLETVRANLETVRARTSGEQNRSTNSTFAAMSSGVISAAARSISSDGELAEAFDVLTGVGAT